MEISVASRLVEKCDRASSHGDREGHVGHEAQAKRKETVFVIHKKLAPAVSQFWDIVPAASAPSYSKM